VAASGVTAIAGFGVLALSEVRMLRDFGLVTLIDLGVSVLGVLLALPSALVLGEPLDQRQRLTLALPSGHASALRAALARLGRRIRGTARRVPA
jgi:hypothetical protein